MAKALVALGHQVTIFALHHNYQELQQRRFVSEGVSVEYLGQMHVRKVGNRKEYFHPLSLLWITAMATLRLSWAVVRQPGDLVHVCKSQPMNGIAAWIAHKLRSVPVFVDSDDYEALNNRFGGRWQQRLVAWFEDWLPSFADGITAGNSFIADRFRALGYPEERLVIVHNGADRDAFAALDTPAGATRLAGMQRELGIQEGQPVIVYVGSMSLVSHAIDLLLEAFVRVSQRQPDTRLLLVGSGEDIDGLSALSERLGIASQIRFLGRVPTDVIPFYYRLGTVSVDPLWDTVPAASSLSLKLVESIAAGVPCVTTDIGDRRLVAGDAGIAVPPGDAEALANGLLSILTDPAQASFMRRAALALRDSYWWNVRVHAFASLYPYAG